MAAYLPAARVHAGHESGGGHLVAAQALHRQLRRRRPGQPGPHHQAQAEEDPVPAPPDPRLPGRDRPEDRALVTTCTTSSAWLVADIDFPFRGDLRAGLGPHAVVSVVMPALGFCCVLVLLQACVRTGRAGGDTLGDEIVSASQPAKQWTTVSCRCGPYVCAVNGPAGSGARRT